MTLLRISSEAQIKAEDGHAMLYLSGHPINAMLRCQLAGNQRNKVDTAQLFMLQIAVVLAVALCQS